MSLNPELAAHAVAAALGQTPAYPLAMP